jgi:succinoglycan biosynthesis protein ExoM
LTSDRITVCVCTFRRPVDLRRLLDGLTAQDDETFSFDVVVVDNDRHRSAESTVQDVSGMLPGRIHYACEPEQNISLARNRAIRMASGNIVALIDDDESPSHDWLRRLHDVLRSSSASGVLGPVVPDVPPDAPRWLKRARFLHRPRHVTGTPITERDARTGNIMLYRSIFTDEGCWFDPAYGRSGGEDSDFFHRQFKSGATYLWCDEAAVTERVPPERWEASYYVRRSLLTGTVTGQRLQAHNTGTTLVVAKNAAFIAAGVVALLPALLLPQEHRLVITRKIAYCSALVSAYFGWPLISQRPEVTQGS